MTRSVRAGGVAAAVFLMLFGGSIAQAQVAPAAGQIASPPPVVATAVSAVRAGAVASRLLFPETIAAPAPRPASPRVFGTVPLAAALQPTGTRWGRLMTAPLDQPALARLTQGAGNLSRQAQVSFVQSAVAQAVRSRAAAGACGDDGYWASANETLSSGVGDCIDVAVAKMEALRLLGVPQRDLYLTKGRFAGSQADTAALLVRAGEGFWLMPAGSNQVVAADGPGSGFDPSVTYGLGTNWVHGRRQTPPAGN